VVNCSKIGHTSASAIVCLVLIGERERERERERSSDDRMTERKRG